MSLVLTLASRNLFQDRLRFVATLIGIVFSVVLVMVQMGLYLGFGRMVTTMIDHAAADLWVVSKGATSFEDLTLLDIRARDRLPGINGVRLIAREGDRLRLLFDRARASEDDLGRAGLEILARAPMSLEEVFLQLTGSEAQAQAAGAEGVPA